MRNLKIRIMDSTEYELSKALWLECFPDDDHSFVDYYYAKRTKPEYALGAFSGRSKKPIAMMHLLPMKMRFDGKTENVCFVSGVCTHPEYRRRGICGMLFSRAFSLMKDAGYAAAVLQPFDPRFYEKYGFSTFIRRRKVSLSYDEPISFCRTTEIIDHACPPDPAKLLELYNEFTERLSGCSVRDEAYFGLFIEEFLAPHARLVVTENGCCAGYEEDGGFVAYELFMKEGVDPVSLLPKGFTKYVFPLPIGFDPPENADCSIEEFSMIKPISHGFALGNGDFFGFDKY